MLLSWLKQADMAWEHVSLFAFSLNVSYQRCALVQQTHSLHSKNRTLVLGNAVTVLGMKPKRGCYVFRLFFKMGLCSAISFKRSRRELSIDVAEHRSILKNKGVERILVIFQDRPMFSHIIRKVSARAFHWCGWTWVYVENYQNTHYRRFNFVNPQNGGLFFSVFGSPRRVQESLILVCLKANFIRTSQSRFWISSY